jgi:hypothetical protein
MADEGGPFGATFGTSFGTWTETADGAAGSHQVAYNTGWRTGSTSQSVEWSDVNTGGNNFTSAQAAIVVKTSAVSAVDLVPGDAAHAHTAANVTLTQVHAGTAADAAQAHTAENVTLSAAGILAVADALHAHSATNVALTQIHVLIAAVAVHTQTADVVTVILPTTARRPASISGRRLLDQDGGIYLMRTFSSWGMASNLTNAQITQALEGVANRDFNAVTVWIGGTQVLAFGWHQYTNNAGLAFWTGTPWQSSLGPAWQSVDHVVTETARLGIVACLSFCGGFDTQGCGPQWEAASDAQMTAAGVAIANRYTAFDHIVWHIMLDSPHTPSNTRGQRIQALFTGINTTEGASRRPVRWLEPANGASTNSQGWLATGAFNATINTWYDYASNSTEVAETGYAAAVVPAGDSEPPYDGRRRPTAA